MIYQPPGPNHRPEAQPSLWTHPNSQISLFKVATFVCIRVYCAYPSPPHLKATLGDHWDIISGMLGEGVSKGRQRK